MFIISDLGTLYVYTRYATLCVIFVPRSSRFCGNFVIITVVVLKGQPNFDFMNFLDQSNETLNEPLKNLGALNSRKPWIISWTMGPERVGPKVLIFCNKYMNSSLIYGFRSSIEICSMIIKLSPSLLTF